MTPICVNLLRIIVISFAFFLQKVNMKLNDEMKKILDSFKKGVEASRNNVTLFYLNEFMKFNKQINLIH